MLRNTTSDFGLSNGRATQGILSEVWEQAIVGSMTEGLIIADMQGWVKGMNPATVRMYGLEVPSDAQHSISELAKHFDICRPDGTPLPKEEQAVARVMRGERFSDQEELLRRRDTGQTLIASYCGTPVLDQAGHLILGVLTVRDVTVEKQALLEREHLVAELEAERATLQAVIANAPAGIIVGDAQARIILSNPAAEEICGRPTPRHQDFESYATMQPIHQDGTPWLPRDLILTRSALDGETLVGVEMGMITPNGRRDLLYNSAPIRDGQGVVVGAVGIFQDVSKQKRAEWQIAELNRDLRRRAQEARRMAHDQLERRVRERTADLEAANRSLRSEIERRTLAEAQQQQAQAQLAYQAYLLDNIS